MGEPIFTDPLSEGLARQYTEGLALRLTNVDRDEYRKNFVSTISGKLGDPVRALRILTDVGTSVGEDLTALHPSFLFDPPSPLPEDEVKQRVSDKIAATPLWRQAMAKAVSGLEWWQQNVTEPTVATTLATTFKLLPGDQGFEVQMREVAALRASQEALGVRAETLKDAGSIATEAYRKWDTVWGLKGSLELLLDPLNLVGLGLPGLGARAAGSVGLKAIARPLQLVNRIDQAPNAVVERLIGLPVKGLPLPASTTISIGGKQITKALPGLEDLPGIGGAIKGLAAPHWTTQIREARTRTYAAIGEEFRTKGLLFVGGTVDDTAQFLTHLRSSPADGGPVSLGNIMQHLESEFPDARWEKFLDEAALRNPENFANDVADIVMNRERAAVQLERRAGRQAKFTTVFQKVAGDEQRAKELSRGLDNFLYKAESVYLKKVEPTVVRPWSVAHLAFAGFPIMNLAEDVGLATVGMGVNPFGVDDALFRTITSGVNPPDHLLRAEQEGRDMIGRMFGAQSKPVRGRSAVDKVAFAAGGFFVEASGKWSWAMRRGIWTRKYMKEFSKALGEAGVDERQVKALSDFVKTALPADLNDTVKQDMAAKAWQAMSTGDPEAIRLLSASYQPAKMAQRFQTEAVTKMPEIPVNARKRIIQAILEAPVDRDNVEGLADVVRKELFEWHARTPDGVAARIEEYVQAISKRPPTGLFQAMNSLRMIQAATDDVANMPREIMAAAKHAGKGKGNAERSQLWDQAFKDADESVEHLRGLLTGALDRTKPAALKVLGDAAPQERKRLTTSIDSIFDSYDEIGKSAQRAREEVRVARDAHFSVDDGDRTSSFWQRWDDKVDGIWDAERTNRGRLLTTAREGWNELMSVAPRDLGVKDRALFKSGIESMLGETDKELGTVMSDWGKLKDQVAEAGPGTRQAMEDQLGGLEKEIVKLSGHRKDLEKRLLDVGKVSQSRRPSIVREYDGNVKAMRVAIAESKRTGLDNPELLQGQLDQLVEERTGVIRDMLDEPQKVEWDKAQAELAAAKNLRATATLEPEQARLDRVIRSSAAQVRRMEESVSSGRAFTEQQTRVSAERVAMTNFAKAILKANDGDIPPTVRESLDILDQLVNSGQVTGVTPGQFNVSSQRQSLYTRIAELHKSPDVNIHQQQMLRQAELAQDIQPTANLVELVDDGLVEQVSVQGNGAWRVSLTEKGQGALNDIPADLDLKLALEDLPALQKEAATVIDYHMDNMDGLFDELIDIADNPPLTGDQAKLAGGYFGRVARMMEAEPAFLKAAQSARTTAAERTNESYNTLMINYDNKSNFDYIMQRFMPFWMYESRRWPRLIRLAAKRPVMTKYFANLALEWDYGYTPTPWGFEMNPAKGTIAGGLRRSLARDFPEMHGGYRGAIEEGLDWLGRFGFYFAPPITTAVSVMNGELSSIAPPPISNALYGIAAITGDLPPGLEELAFQGRYTNFIVDQVISDKIGKNPQDVRQAANLGDEQAIGELFLAKREAARRFIAMNNTGILRYRPESKREFLASAEDAVEQFIGIDKETQAHIKRMGISPYQLVAVSGFQRRAIRDTIDNYDAWVGSGFALRPVEEQEELLKVDEFWREHERAQVDFETEVALLSDKWTRGEVSGSQARDEYRTIQTARAKLFEFLKSNPRFTGVPITLQERIAWTQKFGNPPPLVHPVDEILEAYYSIDPEKFLDPATGETAWDLFFDAREATLDKFAQEFSPAIVEVARTSLRQGTTPFDRSLKVAAPKIREYFAVRTNLLRDLEQTNPPVAAAYREYRQKLNLAQSFAGDDRERRRLIGEAKKFAAGFSPIPIMEAMVRRTRFQMRQSDPQMAEVYRLWIQRPS